MKSNIITSCKGKRDGVTTFVTSRMIAKGHVTSICSSLLGSTVFLLWLDNSVSHINYIGRNIGNSGSKCKWRVSSPLRVAHTIILHTLVWLYNVVSIYNTWKRTSHPSNIKTWAPISLWLIYPKWLGVH